MSNNTFQILEHEEGPAPTICAHKNKVISCYCHVNYHNQILL